MLVLLDAEEAKHGTLVHRQERKGGFFERGF